MGKWKHLMISLIAFVLISILFSPVSFADGDLDALQQDFFRTYNKEMPGTFHLAQTGHDQASINARQILVKTTPDTKFEAESFGVRWIEGYDRLHEKHIKVVQVPEDTDYDKKFEELSRVKGVVHVEPDYLFEQSSDVRPLRDPLFNEQWYLDRIDLLKAWEVTKGSDDTIVAVIDSGVDGSHPDLEGRVLEGFDFVTNTEGGNEDVLGHGTRVAGIIGANANYIGIAGIDQEVAILPIRAMGEEGTGSVSGEIDSIYYAMEHGADIINMSYVIGEENAFEKAALWEAYDEGIVLVAAAGNYSTEEPMYPASYPQVINVSSTTKEDRLAFFSNYGMGIDVTAPGESIYSTTMDGDYSSEDGTSFSTPIVSGIASLVKAEHPSWGPNEIRYAIENGAKPLNGVEWDYHFGYGRVNAYQTLKSTLPDLEENANVSDSAKEVKSGKRVKDKIHMPLDTNWYTFTVPEETEVTIDLTNESSHVDLVGVLYEETNRDVEEVHVIDDTSMGGNEQYMEELDAGHYYVAVSDYHGRWSEAPYYVQIHYDEEISSEWPYPDVAVYKEEIHYLRDASIIRGFPDGQFKPQHDVARMQALSMLLREKGIDATTYKAPDPHFKDIHPGDEGYERVATAVDLGIITGKKDNTFDPWGSLTRAQMAAMITRTYGFEGTSQVEFTDVGKTHWAYEPIQALVTNEIVKGYPNNTFEPYSPLSRQHFAVMMYQKMTTEM